MALLTCTDTCTAGVQLSFDLCHVHSPLYYPFPMCLPAPSTLPLTHPHTTTPDTLHFSHVISMPVATGFTRTDLKALRLGKEELHVLELKLKALIMDCIHFIDVVQQLLACSRHQEQGVAVAEAAQVGVCTHTYTHVYMCACVNSLVITC